MGMAAFLVPALVCGTAFFINFIAIYYHATRAIPFGTMVCLIFKTFTIVCGLFELFDNYCVLNRLQLIAKD